MAVPDFAQGVQMSFLDTATRARHKAQLDAAKTDTSAKTAAVPNAKSSDRGFSFDDALDIINPLQHIPIVSTIYRAVTGDTIKPLERLAGDTLYGGVPGFLSSAANIAFQKITGKDFGDTAMAWLGFDATQPQTAIAAVDVTPKKMLATTQDSEKPAKVADNAQPAAKQAMITTATQPSLAQIKQGVPAQTIAMDPQSVAALTQSMLNNGIDSDLGLRAVAAYQKMLADSKVANQPPAQLH
ncbi:MAG: hypothetical protein HY243_07005 [Proteobacteria bacterium]|nr:hypothetical protein [Pseudomonadota bacterium]